MNKQELVNAISYQADLTKSDAHAALNAIVEGISDVLKNEDSITLIRLGRFKTIHRAARMGRNPSNGDHIQIRAATFPVFVPSRQLKEAVNY